MWRCQGRRVWQRRRTREGDRDVGPVRPAARRGVPRDRRRARPRLAARRAHPDPRHGGAQVGGRAAHAAHLRHGGREPDGRRLQGRPSRASGLVPQPARAPGRPRPDPRRPLRRAGARRDGRGAPGAVAADGRDLARLRGLPGEDRPRDPDRRARARGGARIGLNGDMNLRAGVDLGGTKIQAVVVDERFNVLGDDRLPTPTRGGPPDVAAAIVESVRNAADAAGADASELGSIGVGSPGDVDDENGTVASASNLPKWEGSFPLAGVLQDELGAAVSLGNDVNVATMAEATLGAGQGYNSMLGVFWGTGVGGGVVIDGKLWLGRDAAGEIGHMVVKLGGAKCPCGRHGCMEAYAGRGAMEARARELARKGEQTDLFAIMEKKGRQRLTSGIWARALVRQDPMAVRLVDRAIEALGAGVASAVNLLDVEAVILGGGLGVRLGDPYRKRLEHAMLPHIFADHRPPPVLLAQLGDLGGAVGAALLTSESKTVRA